MERGGHLRRERRKKERPDVLPARPRREPGDLSVIIDGRRGKEAADGRWINQRVQVDHQSVAEKEGLAKAGGMSECPTTSPLALMPSA